MGFISYSFPAERFLFSDGTTAIRIDDKHDSPQLSIYEHDLSPMNKWTSSVDMQILPNRRARTRPCVQKLPIRENFRKATPRARKSKQGIKFIKKHFTCKLPESSL